LVENDSVKLASVEIGGAIGNEVMILSGLNPGQTVVTAGVNQLREGQKVSVLTDMGEPSTSGANR